jgi:hypothetical protein
MLAIKKNARDKQIGERKKIFAALICLNLFNKILSEFLKIQVSSTFRFWRGPPSWLTAFSLCLYMEEREGREKACLFFLL